MSKGFRVLLITLYSVGFGFILYVAWTGREYYGLLLIERPRADLHGLLKPGGHWGHAMGITGSVMLVTLLLYSARKRNRFGLRKGKLSRWLDLHIWLGITGPLLITFHSSFKFGGIVSISYWAMMAVMLSGFVGRYIYIQIPRDEAGAALPLKEIDARIDALGARLVEKHRVPPNLLARLETRTAGPGAGGSLGALVFMFFADLARPLQGMRLRRFVRKASPGLPPKVVREIVGLAQRKNLLVRRRARLRTLNAFLHYWHVIHKPFAYVMLIIMFVHIGVVVAMGEGMGF